MLLVEPADPAGWPRVPWSPALRQDRQDLFSTLFESARRSAANQPVALPWVVAHGESSRRQAGWPDTAQVEPGRQGRKRGASRRSSRSADLHEARRPGEAREGRATKRSNPQPGPDRTSEPQTQAPQAENQEEHQDPEGTTQQTREMPPAPVLPTAGEQGSPALNLAAVWPVFPALMFDRPSNQAVAHQGPGQPGEGSGAGQPDALAVMTLSPSALPETVRPQPDGPDRQQQGPTAGSAGRAAGEPGSPRPGTTFENLIEVASQRRGLPPGPRAAGSLSGLHTAGRGIELDQARALSELARVVRGQLGPGHSRMLLQLEPPELGQVRVDIRLHEQMLTLRFEAQTAAGQEALQARMGELRSALEQHGIVVDQVAVEYRPSASPEVPQEGLNQHAGQWTHGDGSGSTWSGQQQEAPRDECPPTPAGDGLAPSEPGPPKAPRLGVDVMV